MADLVGMQQVLQMTSAVERAQMAQQSQTGDIIRAFEKEQEKVNEQLRDQVQEAQDTEETKIRDEDQNRRKQEAERKLFSKGADEKDEEEGAEIIVESGQGRMLDIKA